MAKQRRYSGDETSETLLNWKKDQKSAERLAGSILKLDNYSEIDPSHPLGGRDGKKDLLCKKEEKKFVIGVYFPRTPQKYNVIEKKFLLDYKGVLKNNADDLIFITNQYLTIGERNKLIKASGKDTTIIYHLERISLILNSPIGYGVRLEFLDIELSKEEQLSYFAFKDNELNKIQTKISEILAAFNEPEGISNLPTNKLEEFKGVLETIVGDRNSIYMFGNSMIDRLNVPLNDLLEFRNVLTDIIGSAFVRGFAPVDRLSVPLKELQEFKEILYQLVGNEYFVTFPPISKLNIPLTDLHNFKELLYQIVGNDSFSSFSPISRLNVPVRDLQEFNYTLNETITKMSEVNQLMDKLKK